MSDAMQVAHTRRKEYTQAIAKKENEIEELKELIADLDSFLEFGEALLGSPPEPVARDVVSRPIVHVAEEPQVDPENEWAQDEDEKQSIASVLSQRAG